MLLIGGKIILLAIDRAARRGEHKSFQAAHFLRGFEKIERADNILLAIEDRIGHAFANIELRRVVIHDLELMLAKNLADELRVRNIALDELSFGLEIIDTARA